MNALQYRYQLIPISYISIVALSIDISYDFNNPHIAAHHAVSDHNFDQLRRLHQKVNAYNSKPRIMCQQKCYRHHNNPCKHGIKQKRHQRFSARTQCKIRSMAERTERHNDCRHCNKACRQRLDFLRSIVNRWEKASHKKHDQAP